DPSGRPAHRGHRRPGAGGRLRRDRRRAAGHRRGAVLAMTATFVRLKLRVLRNGFRGKPARIVMFVVSIFLGLWFGGFGCAALLSSFHPKFPQLGALIPTVGGALLTIGWVFGPLVWFGVDETLNPSRFALLPLRRATL